MIKCVCTVDVMEDGEKILRGTEGTVVSIYRGGEGYAVEFAAGRKVPVVVTVYPVQLEPVKR